MSEIKPVYQFKRNSDHEEVWRDCNEGQYNAALEQPTFYVVQILYPAAALEAQVSTNEQLQADHKENYLLLQETLQENAAQAKRIAELEAIDERQLEEILFTVTDGLATHNLRFVMLDSINHILKRSAQKGTVR